ncbi:MAG: hypothetical protein HOP17_08660 [Acidobacteria bacterium]|nr:hypothetical protein [Acidobacteriota bacterium]
MKYIYSIFFLLAIVVSAGIAASAQETQERVVDEVVAQVNEGVITLSRIKRESKSIVDEQVKAGKSREEAQKMVDEKQGEMIANLINEELLVQKAKELNLDSQVDGTINERFLQIMKQYNLKSLDQLYKAMEEQGADPTEIREVWRKQAIRDAVLQREVQQKEYWKPNGKELREYFEKNKAKFTKPETISISEIFLSFAGRDENATREKAKQLVAQLRGGADFGKIVAENSDRPEAAKTKGKVDSMNVKDLDEKFATALKDVKAGGYSDPIQIDEVGINILRVDERTQASSESYFDESAVRMAILAEKAPTATKEFMSTLRQDSYIKIGETYRPLVSPILFAEERKEKAPAKAEEAKVKKNPGK